MGAPPDVLSFKIFVSARFGALDTKAKFHHVMRCCPSCGAPLVLFRDKFGELSSGRSPGGTSRSPPTKLPAYSDTGQDSLTGISGGWVCTKCGVHIVPNEKTQGNVQSPRERKPNVGGASPDKNMARSPQRNSSSRDNSPHRSSVSHQHQGTPQSPNKPEKAGASPTSPKPPVIIDDDYEIWERHVRSSFMSFLTQVRERLGQKEASLKQYQVTLCQRERQLRSNEEGMQQRLNKMKQSEQNFRTKMDRLNLYKDTMINQLEAKARQLTHYEQRVRNNLDHHSPEVEHKGSARDMNESLRNPRGSNGDLRGLSDDLQNISVQSARNKSVDAKNTSRDFWNMSSSSERPNSTFNSVSEPVRSPKSPQQGESRADHRSNVGVTMVKPLDIRTSASSIPGDARGSQSASTRDFRPNGTSSANINQIYTKKDRTNLFNMPVIQKTHPYPQRPQQQAPVNQYQDNSKERKWRPIQKAASPPTSPKNSSYDVRPSVYPNRPVVEMSKRNGSVSDIRGTRQLVPPQTVPMPLKSALKSPDNTAQRWSTHANLHVTTNGHRPQTVAAFVEQDSISPTERERSASAVSDLSPTYTTSGYASDRENSLNGVRKPEKEKHNVSFDDMISTSSPQNTVERDTRPSWMKRRSRRLTEV